MWGCFELALSAQGGEGIDFDSPQSARPPLCQQPAPLSPSQGLITRPNVHYRVRPRGSYLHCGSGVLEKSHASRSFFLLKHPSALQDPGAGEASAPATAYRATMCARLEMDVSPLPPTDKV